MTSSAYIKQCTGRPFSYTKSGVSCKYLGKSAGLQSKIYILNHYCEDWCLNVNTSKTKMLVFNKAGRHYRLNFKINHVPLESVNEYKYLSTHFCASGSFSYAQEQLYKKGLKAYFKLTKDFLSMHPPKFLFYWC
jgi:hypothetical protein